MLYGIIGLVIGCVGGFLLGIWYRKSKAKEAEAKIANADEEALRIVNDAIKSAETKKKEMLLEIGYHDNYADARWIEGNREAIARQLGLSLTEFFGLPFIYPMETRYGTVVLSSGSLLLRARPDQEAEIVTRMPAGASVSVHGEWQGWYVVHYGVYVGYAAAQYIQLG